MNKVELLEKAFDKACDQLEVETQNYCQCPKMQFGFTPSCCSDEFCNGSNKDCWKEWCIAHVKTTCTKGNL